MYLQGVDDDNITLKLLQPLVNGAEYKADNLIHKSVVDLGGGEHTLKIYAANNLGDYHVKDEAITLPYISELLVIVML